MNPQRVFRGDSTIGIWVRVAALNIVVSALVVWVLTTILNDNQDLQNRQFIYAINRSSCAAYSLVDPTIRANNTLLVSLEKAINDPATKPATVSQDKVRRASVNKQNGAFLSFRNIYGTIPLDYDCARLPKRPPK